MTEILYTAHLEGSLLLTKEGQWVHNGKVFENQKLSDLFHRSIVWSADDEQYYVRIGAQRATFTNEGFVYFVSSISGDTPPLTLHCLHGVEALLDPNTLTLNDDHSFSCSLGNGHIARLLKNAHQALAQYVTSENTLQFGSCVITISPPP